MQQLSRNEPLSPSSGILRPRYDLQAVKPAVVHIGLGGFHRSHFARYTHDLMEIDLGAMRWGIIGAGLRDSDKPLLDTLRRQDGLYTLVERDAAGETRTLIGAIAGVIDASASTAELLSAIARPQTGLVSITVSEAGYHLDAATKTLDFLSAAVQHDVSNAGEPRTMPGILVEAYRNRRDAGLPAFTALSCDNIRHNGNVLRGAVLSLAERSNPGLSAWIAQYARFPNSMVDRITPIPTRQEIEAFGTKHSIADGATVFCEAFRQWVIEDDFADGRPDWSLAGAQFVRDVAPYEAMKLRLLNASHLAIAGLGHLRGYETVEETMRDPSIRRYMSRLMDEETGPPLAPAPGIDLPRYKAALIERFANPAIRDTVQRINTDAPINLLLDPLRDALAAGMPIELLTLGLAAWCKRVCDELRNGRRVAGANARPELDAYPAAGDPAALLSITSLFGDLATNERLARSIRAWLERLERDGIEIVLGGIA